MTGLSEHRPSRVGRGWRILMVMIASGMVAVVATVAGEKPWVAIAVLAATALVGIARVALTRFELFTLGMVAARTAIELSHNGADDGLLRLSVLITGAYTAVAGLWLFVNRMDRPLQISPVAKCAGILTGAALVSAVLSNDRDQALTGASRWVFLTVFVVVLENLITDQRAVRRLLLAVCASTLVPLAFGTWQLIEGGGRLSDNISRVEGSFAHPNSFGFYLMVIALVLIAIIRNLPRRVVVPAGLLLAVVIVNLVATYSRTSYAAFVVGLVVLGLAGKRWLLLTLGMAAVAAASFVPAVNDRLSDLGDVESVRGTPGNSLAWRMEYWPDVLSAGAGRRVTGLGMGLVSDVTAQGREPHNDFVRAFVELGGIGLVAYAALLLAMGWQVRAARLRTSPAKGCPGLARALADGYFGIFAAYLVSSLTGNIMTQVILLWYVFAIAVAASQPVRTGPLDNRDGPASAPPARIEAAHG